MNKFFIILLFIPFFLKAIPGDNCSSAILVSTNGCSSLGQYTNSGITGTLSNPSCFTTGNNNGMWFKFIATTSVVSISVNGTSLSKVQFALIGNSSNDCSASSFLELACTSSSTNTANLSYSSLSIGNTYFIYVDGTNNITGTFQLCVNALTSPQNDDPCSAIELNANNFCSNNNAYSNSGATSESLMNTIPACFGSGNTLNTVYFKYTAIGSNNTIRINGSATGLNRPQVAIIELSTDCNGTNYSVNGCQQASAGQNSVTLDVNNLIPGNEYFIIVDGYQNNIGSFQICINSYAPTVTVQNDDCSGAINLCPNTSYYSSTRNATPNATNEPREGGIYDEWNCNGVVDNSVWFKFTSKTSPENIVFNLNNSCSGGALQFEVFRRADGQTPCSNNSNSNGVTWQKIKCLTSTSANSSQTLTILAANLLPNTDYYLIVDNYPNEYCDFNFVITGNKGADAGPDVTLCKNSDPIQLTGESPVGGAWNGPGVNASGLFNPSLVSVGNQVVYYESQGCTATKNIIVADVNVVLPNDIEVCAGSSTQLSSSIQVTPNNSNYTFQWSPNQNIDNINSLTPTITPTENIVYTLSATDQNGCEHSDQINIVVQTNSAVQVEVADQTICSSGVATITANVNPPGNYDYNWTVPNACPLPGNVESFTTSIEGDYTVQLIPKNFLCNSDFEDYQISSSFLIVNENLVPCWQTSASDNSIEIWKTGSIPAYSGNQFIEINANNTGTLSQDNILLNQDNELEISFAHRGRSGVDVVKVLIGQTGGPYVTLGIFSTNNSNWALYTMNYVVPTTGNYSLLFESVSSTGGSSYGNFIDAVSIKLKDCPILPATGTLSVLSSPTIDITASNSVCLGEDATIHFSGTPNATFEYAINNGVIQNNILDGTGSFDLNTGNILNTYTINVSKVELSTCSQDIDVMHTITILTSPSATMSQGGKYCSNNTPNNIVVTTTGETNWTIIYTLNGVENTISSSINEFTLGNEAGEYILTNVTDNNCSTDLNLSEIIEIIQTPTPDSPIDISSCDNYVLPALTNGFYYTQMNGQGASITEGSTINFTQTLYVYAETGTTPNCSAEESFVVTINQTPTVDSPIDVTSCDNYVLPTLSNGSYYSESNSQGTNLPIGTTLNSTQTVYVYAESGTTPNCSSESNFIVTINQTPIVDSPIDVSSCDNYVLPTLTNGAYYTQTNGQGMNLPTGTLLNSTQTIYVYAETGTTPNCVNENDFIVTINQTPTVDSPIDVSSCDNYILPSLTNGAYYSQANGQGMNLPTGTSLNSTQTIYVYAETGTTPNCVNENDFIVTINQTPTVDSPIDVSSCDNYVLPILTDGSYYTESNGQGTNLPIGTSLNSTQTVYVYEETGTIPNCSAEQSFFVTIIEIPILNSTLDVSSCDSYELPSLMNGSYYTQTNGQGNNLQSGTILNSSQTIYVYEETGTIPNCTSEHSFLVTINQTPIVDSPIDVSVCDSYELPNLVNGSYFTQSNGQGTNLTTSSILNSTQTVYVYEETGTTPNCSAEESFVITINQTPTVDSPIDVSSCDNYVLPILTNGSYYTQANGQGTNLQSGTTLNSTQTVYVYEETGTIPNCTSEHSFLVTINQTPIVDSPIDVSSCDSYELLNLTNGSYYTQSNGQGTNLTTGSILNSTQTVYVYEETGTIPNCSTEHSFIVTINQTPIVDSPLDVSICDSYELPNLINGSYYTQSNGQGDNLQFGSLINSTQTVYVYEETGTTPNCSSESNFEITIYSSPIASFDIKNENVDVMNPIIELSNTSLDNSINNWTFGDGQNSSELNPNHEYAKPSFYTINLEVQNDFGCKSSYSKIIEVKDVLIYYVPNSFTPNGDEYNNSFKPVFYSGYDPSEYQLMIYNRWGELLFESFDLNVGWDGTYKQSGLVQNGTYVWKIIFKVDNFSERKQIVGNINVFK